MLVKNCNRNVDVVDGLCSYDFEVPGIGVRVGHELKILLSRGIQCWRGAKCLYWFDAYADGNGVMER